MKHTKNVRPYTFSQGSRPFLVRFLGALSQPGRHHRGSAPSAWLGWAGPGLRSFPTPCCPLQEDPSVPEASWAAGRGEGVT